jgi:hypothetical protein
MEKLLAFLWWPRQNYCFQDRIRVLDAAFVTARKAIVHVVTDHIQTARYILKANILADILAFIDIGCELQAGSSLIENLTCESYSRPLEEKPFPNSIK